jgi:hypothetical protein
VSREGVKDASGKPVKKTYSDAEITVTLTSAYEWGWGDKVKFCVCIGGRGSKIF